MEEGEIEVDSIEQIGFPDITPELARASGFLGVLDLLKVAKHGKGENIYLVRFHYVPPRSGKRQHSRAKTSPKRKGIVDLLTMPNAAEVEFEPPRMSGNIHKRVDE
jgi:hypothetical protein